MAISADEYEKGNISISDNSTCYYILYKDEPLYLKLPKMECFNIKNEINIDSDVIGKLSNNKVIDVLNDIYYHCDIYLYLRMINLKSLIKSNGKYNKIFMCSGMSNSKYNIPHNGIFDSSVTISFIIDKQDKIYPFCKYKLNHCIKMKIEEMEIKHKFYNLQERSLINIYNIDFGKITLSNGKNSLLYYNNQVLKIFIPSLSYTFLKNGKFGGNLVITCNNDIIDILKSIKHVIKIITKRNIVLETFTISYNTNKLGDFMNFYDRSSFIASLICTFNLEDKLKMYISELQIEKSTTI